MNKKTNFTMIPNQLLLNPRIDDRAKVMWMIAHYFQNLSKSKIAKLGLRKFSEFSSVKNPNTMKKLGDILKEQKWLEILKEDNGRCNKYITHFENQHGQDDNEDSSDVNDNTKPSHEIRPNNINKNTIINSEVSND